jgi:transcriptional regulator
MRHVYIPAAFSLDDTAEVLRILRAAAFGHLVTHAAAVAGPSGLECTALPFLIDDDLHTVRAHVARGNPHWRSIAGADALLIVPVTDAYVSPRWYPSKADHGRVVPTWNYEVVHLHGTIEIHDDTDWVRQMVDDLTDWNEQVVTDGDTTPGWRVADAPLDFVDRQLRAIVGVQLNVSNVEAKQKLSQNRPTADRQGVIEGLHASDRRADRRTAAAMSAVRPRTT